MQGCQCFFSWKERKNCMNIYLVERKSIWIILDRNRLHLKVKNHLLKFKKSFYIRYWCVVVVMFSVSHRCKKQVQIFLLILCLRKCGIKRVYYGFMTRWSDVRFSRKSGVYYIIGVEDHSCIKTVCRPWITSWVFNLWIKMS